MPIQQFCKIAEMSRLNPTTWWMTLEAGGLVREHGLRAGQFLHIKCGGENLLRRPISVALASEDEPFDTAALIFEARGEGTQWLSRRKRGDMVDVLGPLGNGFAVTERDRCLLVGGGIGTPPLLGYAAGQPRRHTAVLGFRSAERVILAGRFQEYCEEVRLCTDDGSLGYHGFVDSQVREILEKDRTFTSVLACGPTPMLKSVAKAAAEFGVPCQVSMEERMGCGVGACLVCAVRMADGSMKHVCKDGPVFPAEEVDWNA